MEYKENILYVDIELLEHKMDLTKRHPRNLNIFFGRIHDTHFEREVETIIEFPEGIQSVLRDYVREIFKK